MTAVVTSATTAVTTCTLNGAIPTTSPTTIATTITNMNDNNNNSNDHTHHYFAIGAMMNPVSVKNRNLNLEVNAKAMPGILRDHKLAFFGIQGFAEVIYEKGASLHGVVYRNVPAEQMAILDHIERDYQRKLVSIECYNNNGGGDNSSSATTMLNNVSVYCRRTEDMERSRSVDRPPGERYLQVLREGAQHYGVDPTYIQFLRDHTQRPRPSPDEYLCFPVAEGALDKIMTRKDVMQVGTGLNGQPLLLMHHGRVIELIQEPETEAMQAEYSHTFDQHGRDIDLYMSKIQYDPKFGIPSCLEEVTPELAACTEHAFCEYMKGHNVMEKWRIIAKLKD